MITNLNNDKDYLRRFSVLKSEEIINLCGILMNPHSNLVDKTINFLINFEIELDKTYKLSSAVKDLVYEVIMGKYKQEDVLYDLSQRLL